MTDTPTFKLLRSATVPSFNGKVLRLYPAVIISSEMEGPNSWLETAVKFNVFDGEWFPLEALKMDDRTPEEQEWIELHIPKPDEDAVITDEAVQENAANPVLQWTIVTEGSCTHKGQEFTEGEIIMPEFNDWPSTTSRLQAELCIYPQWLPEGFDPDAIDDSTYVEWAELLLIDADGKGCKSSKLLAQYLKRGLVVATA